MSKKDEKQYDEDGWEQLDDLYGESFYYQRARYGYEQEAEEGKAVRKRRWWEVWKEDEDGEEGDDKDQKGSWNLKSWGNYRRPRITLSDVKAITNPYEGRSESLRSFYEQFAGYITQASEINVEESEGDEWTKDWRRHSVGYVARGDLPRPIAKGLILRALADLMYGSAPDSPKPDRVAKKLGSYVDLQWEYEKALLDYEDEYRAWEIEKVTAERFGKPAPQQPQAPRVPNAKELAMQGTPALDWKGIKRYLDSIVSVLGERRSLPDLVEEFATADEIYHLLDEYDSERALMAHDGYLDLIKRTEEAEIDIRDIFKKADTSKIESELISRTDIREEIRRGVIREVMAGFLYPRRVPTDGWTPVMTAALAALQKHRQDMVSAVDTPGISEVMVRAYEDGLWQILESSEYVEGPSKGGGSGNIVCQIESEDKNLGKDQTPQQGRCVGGSKCGNEKCKGNCDKDGGRPPGTGRGHQRRHLKSALKIAIREFIQDNESIEFVGNYRSGKPIANRLYKHRLAEDKLFGRQVEKDDKDYHFIICLDVSGSVSYGSTDNNYSGSILDQEVTALWAVIKASLNQHRISFTTIPFDSYPTVLGEQMSAEDMLDYLKHNFVFTGGGTDIGAAIQEAEKHIDPAKNNVVLVMTDGEDYGERVTAAWRHLLRKNYGWAFTFANNPGTFGATQVAVVDTENFGKELKKALTTILRQMGPVVVS